MTTDPSYWLDHFNGDVHLAAFVEGGMQRRRCIWCGQLMRPCNLPRHVSARHFQQLTIYDAMQAARTQNDPPPKAG